MSAEIIQFVPKANPNRDAPLCNAPDDFGPASASRLGGTSHTAITLCQADLPPYTAPDGDCA